MLNPYLAHIFINCFFISVSELVPHKFETLNRTSKSMKWLQIFEQWCKYDYPENGSAVYYLRRHNIERMHSSRTFLRGSECICSSVFFTSLHCLTDLIPDLTHLIRWIGRDGAGETRHSIPERCSLTFSNLLLLWRRRGNMRLILFWFFRFLCLMSSTDQFTEVKARRALTVSHVMVVNIVWWKGSPNFHF